MVRRWRFRKPAQNAHLQGAAHNHDARRCRRRVVAVHCVFWESAVCVLRHVDACDRDVKVGSNRPEDEGPNVIAGGDEDLQVSASLDDLVGGSRVFTHLHACLPDTNAGFFLASQPRLLRSFTMLSQVPNPFHLEQDAHRKLQDAPSRYSRSPHASHRTHLHAAKTAKWWTRHHTNVVCPPRNRRPRQLDLHPVLRSLCHVPLATHRS